MFFTDIQEWNETVANFFYFPGILFICVFQMVERFYLVNVIARIDTHFFNILGGNVGYLRIEMNICNQWSCISKFI